MTGLLGSSESSAVRKAKEGERRRRRLSWYRVVVELQRQAANAPPRSTDSQPGLPVVIPRKREISATPRMTSGVPGKNAHCCSYT